MADDTSATGPEAGTEPVGGTAPVGATEPTAGTETIDYGPGGRVNQVDRSSRCSGRTLTTP